MRTATPTHRDPLPKTFERLNAIHQLRPIKDDADYDNAVELVDRLAVLAKPTPDQADYLATLTELIARYDHDHYAADVPAASPIEALKYLMEQNDMSASAMGELLGNRSLGSKLLRGERQLSKTHIRILAERFKVNPALFL
ncbi:type II toxin-antitoxin system HigA family antitoxin [Phycisphaerales bacterium AB-hyl4]|uniref:Type II toxin-antitoxin system HigA family antitoxin n=1 Tax=Natronomicrosphaera hydrolytica TaxID=3242702 RepID=A0ABV4U7V8_9BACT